MTAGGRPRSASGSTGTAGGKTIYGAKKEEVAEKFRKLQAEFDAGRLVDTEQRTTGEYLTRWLQWGACSDRGPGMKQAGNPRVPGLFAQWALLDLNQ